MIRFLLIGMLSAAPAMAQDDSFGETVQRSLEMPGHRSLMQTVTAPDVALAPFETDGCSGGMSWGWRVVADLFPDFEAAQDAVPPWETCCVVHDEAYHNAGAATDAVASFDARLAADQALKRCVVQEGQTHAPELAARYEVSRAQIDYAYGLIADQMFNAVRFGGGPCSGLPWRWGFGYPGCVPGL